MKKAAKKTNPIFEGFDPYARFPVPFDETEKAIQRAVQEYEEFFKRFPEHTPQLMRKYFSSRTLALLVYTLYPNCPLKPSEIFIKFYHNNSDLTQIAYTLGQNYLKQELNFI